MSKRTLTLTLALCCTLLAAPASAMVRSDDVVGPKAQQSYKYSGTINTIDLGTRTITIDGTSYLFPSTQVTLRNKTKSVTQVQQLKKGMRIGFSATGGSGGNRATVTDVWVLE